MTILEFIKDVNSSGIDWLKSQIKLSLVTFILVFAGFVIIDHYLINIGWIPVLLLFAIIIAIADALPVIGVSSCLLPMAVVYSLFWELKAGFYIFGLFVIVMIIKELMEPFIRGKSLGMSPIEEVISSVAGFFVFGANPIGFLLGPLVYIIAKKTYKRFNSKNEPPRNSSSGKNDDDVIDISDEVVDVDD